MGRRLPWLAKLGGFSTVDGTVRGNLATCWIALAAATGAFLQALGGRFTWILRTPPLLFLGRISYTFYLVHVGMLMFFEQYFRPQRA